MWVKGRSMHETAATAASSSSCMGRQNANEYILVAGPIAHDGGVYFVYILYILCVGVLCLNDTGLFYSRIPE